MTREEIITKVQNLINQAYKYDIDSKYYEGLFDEVEKLRQAKKVEPKLKTWHVRDEYSFKELQKELESKGFHNICLC